jgi:hypothetical protein
MAGNKVLTAVDQSHGPPTYKGIIYNYKEKGRKQPAIR